MAPKSGPNRECGSSPDLIHMQGSIESGFKFIHPPHTYTTTLTATFQDYLG